MNMNDAARPIQQPTIFRLGRSNFRSRCRAVDAMLADLTRRYPDARSHEVALLEGSINDDFRTSVDDRPVGIYIAHPNATQTRTGWRWKPGVNTYTFADL